MQPTQEQWLPVVGYEGHYEVSNLGNVRSLDRTLPHARFGTRTYKGRTLSANPSTGGYLQVSLCVGGDANTQRVHVIVAEAFLGPRPEGMDVCHNDGNQTNNALTNLRYDTPLANWEDAKRHANGARFKQTHCANGHELPLPDERGWRPCKACGREKMRRLRSAKGKTSRPDRWIAA